ncbi:MAG TPA: O-antigen ligase family protein, partial [Microbacteriaceae bacterium]|nr:O-antigen ligase family protein [Microbacteriaceae bacterium]
VGGFSTLVIFTLLAGDAWRDSISWWGFGVLAVLLVAGSVILFLRLRPLVAWKKLPKTLALFMLVCVISIAWSFYPGATALGVLVQWCTTLVALFLALCLSWEELLRALGSALRWILGLSLLFEFVVAAFVRNPVLPFWTDYSGHIPQAFYWSRALLFRDGQIQGILGNSNLLSMAALLALVVFGVQYADRTVRRGWGVAWIVIAIVTLALTRSSTVIVATVFTAVVLVFALWTRAARPERRLPIYLSTVAITGAAVASAITFSGPLLQLLGKSDSLTGRTGIWQTVITLAQQRPAFGWGWVSYWAPWVEPFKQLAVIKGVTYLQAHNAWLDVWLQLGILGLIVFATLVLSTFWRTWFFAVDRPRTSLAEQTPFSAITLLPLLILAALLAQSAAESRMLVEGGWMLLVVISVKTKLARP